MAQVIELGSPQAAALQNAVQSKLMEHGWSTDNLDDTSLAEYIVLSIADGRTREAFVKEIAEDFLSLDAGDSAVNAFSYWVFQQAEQICGVDLGYGTQTTQSGQAPQSGSQEPAPSSATASQDTDMDDAKPAQEDSIPTGPKSMRNMPQKGRDRRMLGQVNKAMDRHNNNNAGVHGSIHRIKGAAGGAGRINSHAREPPRGPRATMQRFAGMNQQPKMNQLGNNMPMNNQMNQGNMFGAMTPQQQMQLFAMYEEQARVMAQILSPQQQQQIMSNQMGVNPNVPPQQQQSGKSLFDRIDDGNTRRHDNAENNTLSISQNQVDPASSMEVEPTSQTAEKLEPSTTMCRFNLSCTKADCYFVHQSPAAPPGIAVDMTDTCAFGASCQNRKCTGKHPSPAKLAPQRAEQDCKFFPHCTNPHCPFRHPSMPPCRNGADCNVEGCKFSHSKVPCKFDPCLNPACPYKHAEGQKRGSFADKVWVSNEGGGEGEGSAGGSKDHVSDRRFVDENAGEEELIVPGKAEDNTLDGIAV